MLILGKKIFKKFLKYLFRHIASENRPLQLQIDILMSLGYGTFDDCLTIGHSTQFKHIFCFYMGM